MIWIGTAALAVCMFVTPQRGGEGIPAVDRHSFLEQKENCTCCHKTEASSIQPHEFVIDITENCMSCHTPDRIGRSHPTDVAPLDRFPGMTVAPDLPIDEQGRITCGTCHNPHLPEVTVERYASRQDPEGYLSENGEQIAFYKSFRLRRHAPDAGDDPTCAGCHAEYF